ncbi:MAG: nucleotide exchange factor GrpE [bacterium]|nr:nucleotide exchange factor GrpE [bacterium]
MSEEKGGQTKSPAPAPEVVPPGETDAGAAGEGRVVELADAAGQGEAEVVAEEAERWTRLEDQLDRIQRKVSEYERLLARRDEYVDKLHAEALVARKGLLREAVLPLIRRLLFVVDDLEGVTESMRRGESDGLTRATEAASERLGVVAEVLRDALASYGVEFVAPRAGRAFDPALMEVAAIQETSDENQAGCVAVTVRQGVRYEGRLLRPAQVEVWRRSEHKAPAGAADVEKAPGKGSSDPTGSPTEEPT